jgi:hypothetical protein
MPAYIPRALSGWTDLDRLGQQGPVNSPSDAETQRAYRDNRDRDAATPVRKAMERFNTLIALPSKDSIDNAKSTAR